MSLFKNKEDIKNTEVEAETVEPADEKKGKKIALKIVNIFINVLIVFVLITSILIATLALTSKANGGVPQIFGYSFHTIMSPSMVGGSDEFEGGSYNVGDLVIGKVTNGNTNEVYEIGDIVVFTTKNDNTPDGVEMICHRVIAREDDGNGKYVYTTKGDNNEIADLNTHTAADIVAVTYDHDYHGAVWGGFGNALNYIRSSQGFFLIVLLPMIIFFLYEIVRVVLNALNYKKTKSDQDKEDAEREKQAAVDAAVKAALAAVGKTTDDAAPAEQTAEDAPAEPAGTPAASDMTPEQMEQFKQFLAFQQAQKEQQTASTEPEAKTED